MRTTVEIRDDQRLALSALAQKRGLRGFSTLVQEAVDLFLADQSAAQVEAVVALDVVLTPDESDEVERRIAEVWGTRQPGS